VEREKGRLLGAAATALQPGSFVSWLVVPLLYLALELGKYNGKKRKVGGELANGYFLSALFVTFYRLQLLSALRFSAI
jgi:hypothetical protein